MVTKDFTFFPGCMIPFRHPQIELAARKSLGGVGIGLADAEGFTCCPEPWNVKGTSLEGWLGVAARNLAVGEKSGRDMLVLCNGCFSTLTEAAHIMSGDGEARKKAEKKLSALKLSYGGKTRALHVASALSELGTDKISDSVKKPLKGLKVAVHHGCHLLRPSEVTGFDDPYEPSVLEGLVEALGAEVVRYSGYTDCCGRATHDKDAGLRIGAAKLKSVKKAGAHCVSVVCPACFEQFDLGQLEMKRKLKKDFGIPVLHYCQLLALSQGEDPSGLGLDRHRVELKPVLSRLRK